MTLFRFFGTSQVQARPGHVELGQGSPKGFIWI